MVSFKRKPVKILPPKFTPTDPNAPVYVIEQTLEYFTNYNDYLARLDFYNQKKFICELTGHSCLSYFDALEKEAKEARSVAVDFPEPTKEPILRRVQHSTISRLDQLVDDVYSKMRTEFFVGEMLHARTRDQQRVRARVLQKLVEPSDPAKPTETEVKVRYLCELENNQQLHEYYSPTELFRDRKNFNKMSVRTFIKFAATRENWAGCPWLVKKEYLDKYPGIPTELPAALQKLMERDREETPATPEPRERRRKTALKVEKVSVEGSDDLALMAVSGPGSAWPVWHEERALVEAGKSEDTQSAVGAAADAAGRAIGKALSIWYFLNAYNELLVLSPLNFDAFLAAVCTNDQTVLGELICAMLTLFVDPDEDILAVPFPSQYEPKRPKLEDDEEDEQEEQPDDSPASKYLSLDADWMVRIGKRSYKDGGWQSLVICALYEALYMREWQDNITRLLEKLVLEECSFKSAARGWASLGALEVLEVLDMFVQILHTSPALRQFMEAKADDSTKVRKARAELAKEQKQLVESARVLRVKIHSVPEAERPALERELAEANAQHQELTEKTLELSNQVLHNDCQRLRYLGKDRFYNRYWYMELNGVSRPTKDSPYLMGRLWVQGPLKEDLVHFSAEADERLTAFKRAHFERMYEYKLLTAQREREQHKAQRAKKAKVMQVLPQPAPQQPVRVAPAACPQPAQQPAPQQAIPQAMPMQMHVPQFPPFTPMGVHSPHPQVPQHSPHPQAPQGQGYPMQYQPMRPMQMPMYYQQPMYMPQPQYMMPQQFMPPNGQQIVYMMPSTVNGVTTLVPVQMPMPQGMQMPQMPQGMPQMQMPVQMQQMQQMQMQGMQIQGMPMQGMPMQGMPMQQMPMQMQPGMPMHQMPMQMQPAMVPQPQPTQEPQAEPKQEPKAEEVKAEPEAAAQGAGAEPQEVAKQAEPQTAPTETEPQQAAKAEEPAEPQAAPTETEPQQAAKAEEPTEPSAEAAREASPEDVSMAEPEDEQEDEPMEDEQPANGHANGHLNGLANGHAEPSEPEPVAKGEPNGEKEVEVIEIGSESEREATVEPEAEPAPPAAEPAAEPASEAEAAPEATPEAAKETLKEEPKEPEAAKPPKETEPASEQPKQEPSEDTSEETSEAPSKPAVAESERTVSPETAAADSDTEDDLPPLPERQSVEPVCAMDLKKQVEGDHLILDENDWRFYETEDEFNALMCYMLRGGPREGRLHEKLVKLDQYIRWGIRGRATQSREWRNELAVEKLGHVHNV